MLLEEFIITSNRAASSKQLIILWHKAMIKLGLDRVLFTLLMDHKTIGRRAGPIAILNYPPEWLKEYSSNRYHEIDPVHQHLFTTKGAFTWESLKSIRQFNQKNNPAGGEDWLLRFMNIRFFPSITKKLFKIGQYLHP